MVDEQDAKGPAANGPAPCVKKRKLQGGQTQVLFAVLESLIL